MVLKSIWPVTQILSDSHIRPGKGDATRLNYLFHKLTALLQMLRSQHSTDPSAGFFKDIHIGLTRPIVQDLHQDHMRQTLCWRTSIPTDVPSRREATKTENELKLKSVLEDISHCPGPWTDGHVLQV